MVKPNGIIDLQNLKSLIDEQTVLVSIMYANNEIGTVEPIREIAALIQSLRAQRKNGVPLYFHVDAAQAANYLDLHVSTLKVDLMTLNGGKYMVPSKVEPFLSAEKLSYGTDLWWRAGTGP